jgi:hypothetical protein
LSFQLVMGLTGVWRSFPKNLVSKFALSGDVFLAKFGAFFFRR